MLLVGTIIVAFGAFVWMLFRAREAQSNNLPPLVAPGLALSKVTEAPFRYERRSDFFLRLVDRLVLLAVLLIGGNLTFELGRVALNNGGIAQIALFGPFAQSATFSLLALLGLSILSAIATAIDELRNGNVLRQMILDRLSASEAEKKARADRAPG